MAKIILCRGIQGSGKSTWAREWVLQDPEKRVRFSNDDTRRMLGKYWVPQRETLVASMKQEFLRSAMWWNFDIVIDNMNLNPQEVKFYENIVDRHNNPKPNEIRDSAYHEHYDIEFKDFFIPVEECIARDAKRNGDERIGEAVIRNTYNKYKDIIEAK